MTGGFASPDYILSNAVGFDILVTLISTVCVLDQNFVCHAVLFFSLEFLISVVSFQPFNIFNIILFQGLVF